MAASPVLFLKILPLPEGRETYFIKFSQVVKSQKMKRNILKDPSIIPIHFNPHNASHNTLEDKQGFWERNKLI